MVVIGLVMLVIGMLISKFRLYDLVATSMHLNKGEEFKGNVRELVKNSARVLPGLGFLFILMNYAFMYFNIMHYDSLFIYCVVILAIVASLFYWYKLNGVVYSRKVYITVFILAVCIVMVFTSAMSPKISLEERQLTCKGFYGFNICVNNIDSLALTKELPTVKYRANGSSFMGIKKGYFQTKEHGLCKFQLDLVNGQYIFIETKEHKVFYLSMGEKKETKSLFESIKGAMK